MPLPSVRRMSSTAYSGWCCGRESRALARSRPPDLKTAALERSRHGAPQRRVVVDQQQLAPAPTARLGDGRAGRGRAALDGLDHVTLRSEPLQSGARPSDRDARALPRVVKMHLRAGSGKQCFRNEHPEAQPAFFAGGSRGTARPAVEHFRREAGAVILDRPPPLLIEAHRDQHPPLGELDRVVDQVGEGMPEFRRRESAAAPARSRRQALHRDSSWIPGRP